MIYVVAACVLAVLAALLASGGWVRRSFAILAVVADAGVPFAPPAESHALRAVLALSALVTLMRTLDLLKRRAAVPPWHRVAHVIALIDTFRTTRAPRRMPRALFTSFAYAVPAALGVWLAFAVSPTLHARVAAYWATRWGGGLLLAYACTEFTYGLIWSTYALAGLRVPPIHRAPLLSRSIREFWGQRWNVNVSAWLAAHAFRPLARRGHTSLGIAAAFASSAAIHAYIAEAALGGRWTLIVLVYFVVQGFFALIEGPLGVKRWPAVWAHAWVILLMVTTSPLFCEPFLRVLGAPPP